MAGFKIFLLLAYMLFAKGFSASAQSGQLKLVFIRHAERPDNGDNLDGQGLNRSLLLPNVLFTKFGRVSSIYVPAINKGNTTKRSRMLQTISPYAIKYNMAINSYYQETDAKGLSESLLQDRGTVLIVWEHRNIAPILRCLGITNLPKWPAKDFDSIWIVTFRNGKPGFIEHKEGLRPSPNCSF